MPFFHLNQRIFPLTAVSSLVYTVNHESPLESLKAKLKVTKIYIDDGAGDNALMKMRNSTRLKNSVKIIFKIQHT